jgi:hypothetical protein
MTNSTKLIVITIFFIVYSINIKAQYFSIHPIGEAKFYSSTVSPILHQEGRYPDNAQYIGLKYDQWAMNKKLLIGGFFFRFNGSAGFLVSEPYFGYGNVSTTIYRFGGFAGWNLLASKSRFTMTPFVTLIFQNASIKSPSREIGPIDPLYLPFEGTRFTEVLGGNQIVLGPGFDVSWNPFWKILINIKMCYSFAFKPYQRYIVEYTYNGVPQPDGVWESDGTGMFYSLGLGFRLFDIKMKTKPKSRSKRK